MAQPPAETTPTKIIGRKVVRPRQQIEEQIRSAILTGELHGGERLPPEVELARQFNVSRTTIREALRSLSTQNLITKTPGAKGGSFVSSVDYQSLGTVLADSMHNLLTLGSIEFEEVANVRQLLEVPSARLAAVHRTEHDLDELRGIVDQQRTISVEDPLVPILDERFHIAIGRASDNRVLASFVAALHHETEPVHYLDLSPEVGRTTVVQHQKIVKAISARDPDRTEAAIVEHLTYIRKHILAYRAK